MEGDLERMDILRKGCFENTVLKSKAQWFSVDTYRTKRKGLENRS